MNQIIEELSRIEPISMFIGIAIGICLLTIIILTRKKFRQKIDLTNLKEKVYFIDEKVRENQKNNIIAHKELNELYGMFGQLENSRR